MEHTPGPWKIWDSLTYTIVADEDPIVIAQFPEQHGDDGRGGANARLIAAAPDMLAALEYIVAWSAPADGRWRPETARDLARAAIAKARG